MANNSEPKYYIVDAGETVPERSWKQINLCITSYTQLLRMPKTTRRTMAVIEAE